LKKSFQFRKNWSGKALLQSSSIKNECRTEIAGSWWACTWQKVRKGIDSKQATVAAAIKNEFMSEYIKSQYFFHITKNKHLTILSKLQD